MSGRPTPWLDRGLLPEDMALGRRWGRLRIVGYEVRSAGRSRRRLVICVCLCGTVVTVMPGNLRAAKPTESCGCLHKERAADNMAQLWQQSRARSVPWTMGHPKTRRRRAA